MGAAPARPSPNGLPKPPAPPAGPGRRVAAGLLDLALFVVTLGVGWAVWSWRRWADATTPGQGLLGLGVVDLGTRRPATRRRMAERTLVYQGLALLLGVVTLGLGWLYCVAPLVGPNRRTIYDEWARVLVVDRRS
jgi:uncharacterized RDD family membrane protein YckC